jgi:hypothetical protein
VAYGRIQSIANATLSLNNQSWNIARAAIVIGGSPGAASDLAPGQLVGVTGDPDGTASEVVYTPTIVGALEGLSFQPGQSDCAILSVLDQQIAVTSNTQLAAGLSLQGLSNGDRLQISAIEHVSDGDWYEATYVGRAAAAAEPEVSGIAFIQDPSTSTLDINLLSVNYANATLKGFSTAGVASGDLVRVVGSVAEDGNGESLLATEVDKLPPIPVGVPGDTISFCGVITRFVSARDFAVEGVPITTGPSTVIEPFAEELELGAYVCGSGTITTSAVVLAQLVSIYLRADDLGGNITAIDKAASTITLLGLTLSLGPESKIQDALADPVRRPPLALKDLMVGDYVRVNLATTTPLSAAWVERTADLHTSLLLWAPTPQHYQFGDFSYSGGQVKVSAATQLLIWATIILNGSPLPCGTTAHPCTLAEVQEWPVREALEIDTYSESFKGSFNDGVLEATVEVLDPTD